MTPVLVERIKEVLRALVLCCISIYWLCKAKEPSEGHTGAAPGGWMNPGPWSTGGCDPTPWAWIAPIPPDGAKKPHLNPQSTNPTSPPGSAQTVPPVLGQNLAFLQLGEDGQQIVLAAPQNTALSLLTPL